MRTIVLLLVCAAGLRAQDLFEIHVFEYEPLPPGAFTYEAHLNYVARGTRNYDGLSAPTQGQSHFSSELTAGLTDDLRAAFVLLTAQRPGSSLEYAGFRVVPYLYAPSRWRLPVNLGLVTEFSFAHAAYQQNPAEMELRAIVEKHVGRLQLDGNPTFSRGLGAGIRAGGWEFEPAARIGWQLSKAFTPSVEYYGSWGRVGRLAALRDQVHEIFPGGDLRLGEHLTWSFGLGFGTTRARNFVTVKSHLQFEFGGRKGGQRIVRKN